MNHSSRDHSEFSLHLIKYSIDLYSQELRTLAELRTFSLSIIYKQSSSFLDNQVYAYKLLILEKWCGLFLFFLSRDRFTSSISRRVLHAAEIFLAFSPKGSPQQTDV